MIDFLYYVFDKVDANVSLSPELWTAHPDWNFYVRTNVRHPHKPKLWLGSGGKTREDAVATATESIRLLGGIVMRGIGECIVVGPQEAKGTETNCIITN